MKKILLLFGILILMQKSYAQKNNAISSNNDVVQQTRAYVDLYLSYLQNENLLTDSAYQAQVYYMATLCPLQYGSMVYSAQALYSRANPDALFQDEDACETTEARKMNRKPQPKVFDNIKSLLVNGGINNSSFTIYPNPTKGAFTVSFEKVPTDSKIEIINSLGQTIQSAKASYIEKYNFDFSSFGDGVYQIKVTNIGNGTYSVKSFVITK
jgi:hypothetical protein